MAVRRLALEAAQHQRDTRALPRDHLEATLDPVDAHPVEAFSVHPFERFSVFDVDRAVGRQLADEGH